MKRAAVLLILLGRVLVAIVHAGWQTSMRILLAPHDLSPGLVDYDFPPMGEEATTVLACLICLTPGTTAIAVDARSGHMRLHLLDTALQEATLADIHKLFETPVRTLFTHRSPS